MLVLVLVSYVLMVTAARVWSPDAYFLEVCNDDLERALFHRGETRKWYGMVTPAIVCRNCEASSIVCEIDTVDCVRCAPHLPEWVCWIHSNECVLQTCDLKCILPNVSETCVVEITLK